MMRPLLVAVVGCSAPSPPAEISCAQKGDNVLLYNCSAVAEAGDRVTLSLPTGEEREVDDVRAEAGKLLFSLWRLHEKTSYIVRVDRARGPSLSATVTTDSLPEGLSNQAGATGDLLATHLLLPQLCGGTHIVLLDESGRVVWYVPVDATSFGLHYSEDDTVLAILEDTGVREWTWSQERLLDLEYGVNLDFPVHHDLARVDGETLILVAEPHEAPGGEKYVMDGVLIVDSDGLPVDHWRLADRFDPAETDGGTTALWTERFPDHADWAHLNSIQVADGEWLMSSRTQSAVFAVRGDRKAIDYGDILWSMSPDPLAALGSDLTLSGSEPADFVQQHHPNVNDEGDMLLFDNRSFQNSRVSKWDVDLDASSATLVESWSMDAYCPIQGSAFPVPGGGAVATCVETREVRQFEPGNPAPTWVLSPDCDVQLGFGTRAIPLTFPP